MKASYFYSIGHLVELQTLGLPAFFNFVHFLILSLQLLVFWSWRVEFKPLMSGVWKPQPLHFQPQNISLCQLGHFNWLSDDSNLLYKLWIPNINKNMIKI